MNLSRTNIKDISVLKNCVNLRFLNLSRTNINNISVLENCTNLCSLDLSRTNIEDISVLENCTNLCKLSFYYKTAYLPILKEMRNLYNLRINTEKDIKDDEISELRQLCNHRLSINGRLIKS